MSGQRVAILVDRHLPAGIYEVTWDASPHPSGTYFVRMTFGQEVLYKKVMLVK